MAWLRIAALAAVALALAPGLLAQDQPPAPDKQPTAAAAERIAELIAQLDADKSEAREAATAELRKIGQPAVAALEKTLADPPSIEVKFRAQAALDGIRLDVARSQALAIDDILAQATAAQEKDWDPQVLAAQLENLVRILAEET